MSNDFFDQSSMHTVRFENKKPVVRPSKERLQKKKKVSKYKHYASDFTYEKVRKNPPSMRSFIFGR